MNHSRRISFKKQIALFVLCCVFTSWLNAQQLRYNFYSYGVKKGLPSEMVKCVGQDQQGYIWVGTDEGLAKFNGRTFETIDDFPGGQYVKLILPTDSGIAVGADLGVFHMATQKAGNQFRDLAWEMGKGMNYPKESFCLKNEEEFLSYKNGVARFMDDHLTPIKIPGNYDSNNFVRSFQVFEDGYGGQFILAISGEVFLISGNEARLLATPVELPFKEVSSALNVRPGEVWVGTEAGLYAFKFDEKHQLTSITQVGYLHSVSSLVRLSREFVLVGTWIDGLHGVDLVKNNTVSRIESYLSSNVNGMMIDQDGDLWVASDGGLMLGVKPPFESVLLNKNGPEGFTSGLSMVAGSVHGISGNRLYNIRSSNGVSYPIETPRKESYLLSVAEQQAVLWASSSAGEVYQFMHDDFVKKHFPTPNGESIFHALADGNEGVWLCAEGVPGLLHLSVSGEVMHYGQNEMISHPSIVANVSDDFLWMGAGGSMGLVYELNKVTGEVKDITPELPKQMDSTLVVHDMVVDRQGTGWLATSYGLLRFNGKEITGSWNFAEEEKNPTVKAITIDNTGVLWLGDQDGVVCFDAETEFSARYDLQSGLPSTTISFRGIRANTNGEVWVGTSNGVAVINNAEYRIRSTAMPDVKAFIVDDETQDLLKIAKAKISPTSYIKIELGVPAYPGDHIGFRYRNIAGIGGWKYTKEPSISYGHLKSGELDIEIQACKTGGFHWSDARVIHLTVDEYWFMKKWVWLLFLAGLAGIVWLIVRTISWRHKLENDRLNEMVQDRTLEVEAQKELLLEKNKQIESSLRYAETIQDALLPSKEEFEWVFPKSFILYKPRDIVSGDFYWTAQIRNKLIVVAADCTGHGVPGALMSMIGAQVLNNIVHSKEIDRPDEILEELHYAIRQELRQSKKRGNRDGMDMSIVSIETEINRIEYAGARNPLLIVRDNELIEFKATARSIAGDMTLSKGEKMFKLEVFEYQKGDQMYLYSDGYQDQFGGPKDRKFKVGPFKKLLLDIVGLPPQDQHQKLDDCIETWKSQGKSEQTDDILVIGITL